MLVGDLLLMIFKNNFYQLFLERERAAQLAESKTDELIKDAPTTQHDKSGEWQETSGEIQWVSTEKTDSAEEKQKKEEDDEELDLNKGIFISSGVFKLKIMACLFLQNLLLMHVVIILLLFYGLSSSAQTSFGIQCS